MDSSLEVLALVRHGLLALRPLDGVVAVVVAVFALRALAVRRLAADRAIFVGLGAAITIVAALRVFRSAFLCDDAFVSFRYAENLASGHGLVWNVGERVEGYTNFLHTVCLAMAASLGLDVPLAAVCVDLGAYVGVVACAGVAVRRVRAAACAHAPPAREWPVAAIVLALARPMTTFATSGLETMVATFATLGLLVLAVSGTSPRRVGAMAAVVALVRPDHAVFALSAGAAAFVAGERAPGSTRRAAAHRAMQALLSFAGIFGAYWMARTAYYGDLFPNTFHAKSGGSAYWSQGTIYLLHFLLTTGSWLGVPMLVLAARANLRTETAVSSAHRMLRAFVLTGGTALAAYVVRVGGDFMEHRFLVTPFALFVVLAEVEIRASIDASVREGRTRSTRSTVAFAAVVAAVASVPFRPIPPNEKHLGLAAEETFYPLARVGRGAWIPAFPLRVDAPYERWAARLRAAFAGAPTPPTIAYGSIGILGYRTGFPIVDVLGLTDRRIARLPLERRGRPGHERLATLEDAIASGAELWLAPPSDLVPPFAAFDLQGIPAVLLSAAPDTERRLAAAGVSLDGVRASLAAVDLEPSRTERLRARDLARLAFADDRRARPTIASLEASLGSMHEFDDVQVSWLHARGARRVPADATPIGMGRGALELDSDAELRLPLPPGIDEVRFRTHADRGASFRVEIRDRAGVVHRGVFADGAALVAVRLPRRTTDGALLAVHGSNVAGAVGYLDAVHLPDPREAAWWEASATDAEVRLALLLRMLDELPSHDERMVRLRAAFACVRGFDSAAEFGALRHSVVGPPAFSVVERTRAPGQGPVFGALGVGHLSGYVRGDGPTGSFPVPLGTRGPTLVSFRLAGGADCERERVEIRAGRRVLHVACAEGDERFRAHRIRIVEATPEELELVLVDRSSDGFGHLLLDALVVTNGLP